MRGFLRTAAGRRPTMAKAANLGGGRRKRLRLSIHRQYTIEEAARAIGRCRATIKRMIRSGLPVIADRRPILILGENLAHFIRSRRKRQPCALDECYCFRCRMPRKMTAGLTDYEAKSATGGNITALCVSCGTVMNKRFANSRLPALLALVEVSVRQASPHLSDSPTACLNDPLHKYWRPHA